MPNDEGGTTTGAPSGNEIVPNSLRLERDDVAEVSYEAGFGDRGTTVFRLRDGRFVRTSQPILNNADGSFVLQGVMSFEPVIGQADTMSFSAPERFTWALMDRPPLGYCTCELCRPAASPAERNRLEREAMERAQALQAEVRQAEERATETLRMVLLPDELERFNTTGELVVTGADDRKYRIGVGNVYNVSLFDARGVTLANLCCHPTMYDRHGQLPMQDVYVAQVLWLRYDLEEFWGNANIDWKNDGERSRFRGAPSLRAYLQRSKEGA